MQIALGHLAFHPGLTPDSLYRKAAEMMEEDLRDSWQEFAADLAGILALPEIRYEDLNVKGDI